MSNKEMISKSLAMLSIVFQEKKTSEEFYKIYQEFLSDIPGEIIINAIKACIRECRFFPTIAEIRQKAEPYLEELRMIKFRKCMEQKTIEEKTNKEKDAADSIAYTKRRIAFLEDKKIKGTASREEIELLEKIKFGMAQDEQSG